MTLVVLLQTSPMEGVGAYRWLSKALAECFLFPLLLTKQFILTIDSIKMDPDTMTSRIGSELCILEQIYHLGSGDVSFWKLT